MQRQGGRNTKARKQRSGAFIIMISLEGFFIRRVEDNAVLRNKDIF